MLKLFTLAFVCLVVTPALAANDAGCSTTSSASDVHAALTLASDHTVFHSGEIIPLSLAFTAAASHRYLINNRSYDRSGRLEIDQFCLDPEAPDPIAAYFESGIMMGGGLFNIEDLGIKPFVAHADLNEFRILAPGHYRLYVVSYRVSRSSDANEDAFSDKVPVTVRSNTLEFEVRAASAQWQRQQLDSALTTLATQIPTGPGESINEVVRHAARVLRFLDTKDSTRQLATLFNGRDSGEQNNWEFYFGLYGSPYRQIAIEAMHREIAKPAHAISDDFLDLLAKLEAPAPTDSDSVHWLDTAFDVPGKQALIDETLEAFPRKTRLARALTALSLIRMQRLDTAQIQTLFPAVIAGWNALPPATRRTLIEDRWSDIASAAHGSNTDLLPILLPLVDATPNALSSGRLRDAALKHIYEIDPATALPLILHDLQDRRTEPSPNLIRLLSRAEITSLLPAVVDRITGSTPGNARNLDYTLLDRYADASALATMQAAFEQNFGKWSCAPQASMLRYFLRVAPEYGVTQVAASLKVRKDAYCFNSLLEDLGDQLPQAERIAVEALDDPDTKVDQNAAQALGKWGTSVAEPALLARLERFHEEWSGRADDLRKSHDRDSEAASAAALQEELVSAITGGTAWLSSREMLVRLQTLVVTDRELKEIQFMIDHWRQSAPIIEPNWYSGESPTFNLLQSSSLTEEQLSIKLAQFPRGTTVQWQFWLPGTANPPVSMEIQEAAYEQVRAAAEAHGIIVQKTNHPEESR